MKQYEAVIKVMNQFGGYATLGQLYQHAINITGVDWKTKTPYASIRRIVQDKRHFFKIRPGLWALNSRRTEVLSKLTLSKNTSKIRENEFSHTYFQGLIVEIGKLKGFSSFVPNQDKNKIYLSKRLCEYTTDVKQYDFSYPELVRKANSVDVSWFNERRLPDSFFEIEHTTSIDRSLLKFLDFQDFNINFTIVADKIRKKEFDYKLKSNAFNPILKRVRFADYELISQYHSKLFELNQLNNLLSR
jgi:hypothetical protein